MMQLDAIVPGGSMQTILSNVLVTIVSGKVRLTASDMESTVRVSIPADDTSEGELIVKAKKLSEIARGLNSDEMIFEAQPAEESDSSSESGENLNQYTVRLEGSGGRAAKFRMTGSDRSHFPDLNEVPADGLSSLPSDILSEMISKTFYSISQEDNRYIYNGLSFQTEGNKLTIVGTDGRRLAAITRTLPEPIDLSSGDKSSPVVHAKAIRELQKIIEIDEKIFLGIEQRDIFFKVGDAELSSRLLEGTFPDYKKVIPQNWEYQFDIDRELILDSIKQVMVMTEQPSFQVKMTLSAEGVKLRANTPDVGEAEIDIPVDVEGADMEIGFNANYFLDILKCIRSEKVNLSFLDPARPIVFRDPDDPDFIALVMPMKI